MARKYNFDAVLSPEWIARRIRIDERTGCWHWTMGKSKGGYGKFGSNNGPTVIAHRAFYEHFVGPIPEGLLALHKCDIHVPPGDTSYRSCCNPEHLFVGTELDNARDASGKGRMRRGERHHKTSLTEEMVAEIRASSESQSALAKRLGITQPAVSLIRARKNWAHVA